MSSETTDYKPLTVQAVLTFCERCDLELYLPASGVLYNSYVEAHCPKCNSGSVFYTVLPGHLCEGGGQA